MLVLGFCLLGGFLHDGADAADSLAAGRPGPGENDSTNEVRPVVCNHLRDETAHRESDEIDLRQFEPPMNATASRGMSAMLSGVLPSEPPTPRLSKAMTRCVLARPSMTPRASIAPRRSVGSTTSPRARALKRARSPAPSMPARSSFVRSSRRSRPCRPRWPGLPRPRRSRRRTRLARPSPFPPRVLTPRASVGDRGSALRRTNSIDGSGRPSQNPGMAARVASSSLSNGSSDPRAIGPVAAPLHRPLAARPVAAREAAHGAERRRRDDGGGV
jgi:hypothetical protein